MDSVRDRQFDVIVFGASGYTGKYVVEELAKIYTEHNLKWAVAGRKISKLQASLREVQEFVEDNDFMHNVEILTADVEDQDSLSRMCRKTRLILNCVGPYLFHGEHVVRACIENGTHHVDISGEFKYLEGTQAKYFHDAREKGVYIVQACGFDSIPSDLGTAALKKKFNGQLEAVEIFVKFEDSPEGKVINIGTWMSAVHSIGSIFQTKKIRDDLKEKVFTKKIAVYKPGQGLSMPVSYYGRSKKWCLPLPSPDVPVIQRSQMFNYQFFDEAPVQKIKVFLSVSSFIRALGIIFVGCIVGGLSMFSFGRYLLGKFPQFFSAGYFSNQGPNRKQVMSSSVIVTLCGSGHGDDSVEADDDVHEKAKLLSGREKSLTLKIIGPEPAYVLTSICMVHAGLVILEEADRMPLEGGVLTPGAAFANTTLVSRLKARGIQFEWMK